MGSSESDIHVLPASRAQEAIWYEQEARRTGSNCGHFSVTLQGSVPESAVREACRVVVRRHPALRTLFSPGNDGRLLRTVRPADDVFHCTTEELPAPAGKEIAATREWVRSRYGTCSWPLRTEPPARFHILRHGPGRTTLAVVVHHIGFDGRSKFLFAREFSAALTALRAGEPPEETPLEEPAETGEESPGTDERVRRRWAELASVEAGTRLLPGAAPAGSVPGGSVPGGERPGDEGPVLTSPRFDVPEGPALRRLARAGGTSLFSALMACTAAQLTAYGNPCPALSVTVDSSTPDNRHLIGMQVNVVPVALPVRPDDTFHDLLKTARGALEQVDLVRRLPFQDLVRAGRAQGAEETWGRIGLSYPRVPGDLPGIPGLAPQWDFFAPNFAATFDVTLQVRATAEECFGRVDYVDGLLDAGSAELIGAHFQRVARAFTDRPDTPVSRLDLRADATRRAARARWESPASARQDRATGARATDAEEAPARATGTRAEEVPGAEAEVPDAVVRLAGALPADADATAAAVATAVHEELARAGVPLRALVGCGVRDPADPRLYATLCAVIRYGAVPVLPSGPSVPGGPEGTEGPDAAEYRVVFPAEGSEAGPRAVRCPGVAGPGGDDRPRRVLAQAVALAARQARAEAEAGRRPRVLALSPVSSRGFLQELLTAWYARGTLVVPPGDVPHDPEEILAALRDGAHPADLALVPPPLLQPLAARAVAGPAPAPPVTVVVPHGRPAATDELHRWRRAGAVLRLQLTDPDADVVAVGALTEDGWLLTDRVDGRALHARSAHTDHPLPEGVPGTLWQGAPGTDGAGPLRAAGAEVTLRADGALLLHEGTGEEHVGALERALCSLESVGEACVLPGACEDGGALAVLVPAPGHRVDSADPGFRRMLHDALADQEVPGRIRVADRCPRTPEGRIDRERILREHQESRLMSQSQQLTPLQQAVARMWQETLESGELDLDTNFFLAGGHSLLATRVLTKVAEEFSIELTFRDLLENPTVGEFSAAVEQAMLDHLRAGGAGSR